MSEFDFSKVVKQSSLSNDPDFTNPVKFFYKLSHPEVTDPRPSQYDMLNKWFDAYNLGQNDNVISLNTGAGKTLVGLYIAESIRRATGGKVLYICPNNLLGKQTIDEAKKNGLEVSSYLNLDGNGTKWAYGDDYLSNERVCITNYHAVFNSRSIFSSDELKGVIFDDAHIALELLDQQYKISITDERLVKDIALVFSESPSIEHKIASILEDDPQSMVMIPPLEWLKFNDVIRKKLVKEKIEEVDPFGWANIREVFSKTLCFISPKRVDISLLYPNIENHFLFKKDIHRVYLSATVPNLGDIIRVFGVEPTRIHSNNTDYRPERLFIFMKKTCINNADEVLRTNLVNLVDKALVLVPSNYKLQIYAKYGISIPTTSREVMAQTQKFKNGQGDILCLAGRYDGIDFPGNICHTLVIDGLPNSGDLKTRFFSDYFHNGKNFFLRSIIASKLVQAFGRTVRSSDDYSVIFLLDRKLHRWIANKDNERFFKSDLLIDLDIGLRVSSRITSLESLSSLTESVFQRTQGWKDYIETERGSVTLEGDVPNLDSENDDMAIARIERKIFNDYIQDNYAGCVEKILENYDDIGRYSKPILGLYLSVASVCALAINDDRVHDLSSQAYGINKVFGRPTSDDQKKKRSIQAQKIIDFRGRIPDFNIIMTEPQFNEALKDLGLALGYDSYRPDTEGEGTLDACWFDQESEIVLGLENKTNKTNKTLFKKEIDQSSGHLNCLSDEYPDYIKAVYIIGEIEEYGEEASPRDLLYIVSGLLKEVELKVRELHKHIHNPLALDRKIDDLDLRISDIFPDNKVADLKSVKLN